MIVIDAANRSLRAWDAKITLATQLAALGHRVALSASTLPQEFDRGRTYEASPFLADAGDLDASVIIVLSADEFDDQVLPELREQVGRSGARVVAVGRFADLQSKLGAQAKLAYALGREPIVVDLSDFQPRPLLPKTAMPLVAEIAPPQSAEGRRVPGLTIALGGTALEDPEYLPRLARMAHRTAFKLRVVANSEQRELIRGSRYHDLPVVTFTELSPVVLAAGTDVFAVYGQGVPGERMAALAVCVLGAGGAVLDCTEDRAFMSQGAPVLRGPEDPLSLETYLTETVIVNLPQIAQQVTASPWMAGVDIARLESLAGLDRPVPARKSKASGKKPGRTVFMPTNGVGLGHAQRCAVIADAMPDSNKPAFAAFPSCVPMITGRGYDCMPLVQRSDAHIEPFANDVLTYLRLGQLLGQTDSLIFDGGYVFDSIFRTIQERGVRSAWIRRGLWPQGSGSNEAIDREYIFDKIIVPSEAFPELNDTYGSGRSVSLVGPIFRQKPASQADRSALRRRISQNFGLGFDKLVVSMLGGGVASDRTAHLQAISGMLAKQPDALHLVVVWPGSQVAPGLLAWPNTRVVQTLDALQLMLAADLTISAAGYNSVHEILYHRVPAILIPQSAPYLDDQTRRARALSERGLCETIEETELLRLERTVVDCLVRDGQSRLGKALAEVELPEPGAKEAAKLIAELAEADR